MTILADLRAAMTAAGLGAVIAAAVCGNALALEVPVPTPRPATGIGGTPFAPEPEARPSVAEKAIAAPAPSVVPVSGSLKDGLKALSDRDGARALAIRAGMRPGSLDRKMLAWAIATSGAPGIPSSEIAQIARELPDWPAQESMRRSSEAALAAEGHDPQAIIAAFGKSRPESLAGAVLLAQSHMQTGNRKAANAAIAPMWREEKLSKADEEYVLKRVGNALTKEDHRFRMHKQFYRERASDGMRMASLAGQTSLAKAWAAVIKNDKDADKLLAAVDPSLRKDAGYIFAKLKRARRQDKTQEAAKLVLSAPKDAASLVDPDEWWVERRIISRDLLDAGDARTAYKIAAAHSAESPRDAAEAEFHAGWYALRFLNDPARAAKHFSKVLESSSTPITQARGHYWLGRAKAGPAALAHYKASAQHKGTFYGQLSAQKLGQGRLVMTNPKPGAGDKTRFSQREQVQALIAFESAGEDRRAGIFYRHLAESLNSPGELALLAARAENRGNRPLALQVGKTAHQRGLEVDTVSWPIGAIPSSAKIGDTGKALAYAIARQESAFNVSAVSPADARGLLQLLPGTAKMMAKKTGLAYNAGKLTTDAGYNATLGAAYLSEQLDNFGNSYILTFAGYNAGPGRVREWLERYGDPRGKNIDAVVDWIERIPFTETRNYVMRVMENYQVYKARLSNSRLDIEGDLRHGRR